MYFDLTEEQEMIRDTLDGLLVDHLDDAAKVLQIDEKLSIDSALWSKLSELGLTGILVPEELGGVGMDLLTLTVAAESLGYAGGMSPMNDHNLVAYAIAYTGDDTLKNELLPQLVGGEKIATLALNEDNQQWSPEDWTMNADGNTLSGVKTDVVMGVAANVFLVGLADGKLAIVDAQAEGVTVDPILSIDATRSISTLTLDKAPCTLLNADLAFTEKLLDALRILIAADAHGCSRKVIDIAVEYAKTREQFGRLIGSFQGLKYQLADMVVDTEPCKALVWYAAHAWDVIPEESAISAARAKAHVTQIALKTARMAVETHGGIGYTWEYPLHLWLKRAMFNYALLGTPSVHRERIAELLVW